MKVRSDDPTSIFVGLDVDKNYLQAAVVGSEGTLLKEARRPNDPHETEKFFAEMQRSQLSHRRLGIVYRRQQVVLLSCEGQGDSIRLGEE